MRISGKALAFASGTVVVLGAAATQLPDSTLHRGATANTAASGADVSISLKVDISERKLYVRRDGDVINTYPVTVGTAQYPTPKGTFGVRRMIWNPKWVPPNSEWAKNEKVRYPGDPKNPMGKVKIFFEEPDYYLHGTLSVKELGTAASHGCVRLRNEDIIELGTLLMEEGGAKVEPGFFRSIINRVRSTREVRLQNPVQLEVTE